MTVNLTKNNSSYKLKAVKRNSFCFFDIKKEQNNG